MTQWRFQATTIKQTAAQSVSRFAPYQGDGGNFIPGTSEVVQTKHYTAYTVSQLRISVTLIAGTGTAALRDDGVSSTNQTISITTTGWKEDVTGTDTPAANSLCDLIYSGGASHGDGTTCNGFLITYEHASTNSPLFGGSLPFVSVDSFTPPSTSGGSTTPEAGTKYRCKQAANVSNLREVWGTASASGMTSSIGKNGVSSTNVTVAPTTTGAIEDTTGSESLASGDDLNIRSIRTANSWSATTIQAQVDHQTQLTGLNPATAWSPTTRVYQPFTADTNFTAADDNYTMRCGSITAQNLQCYVSAAGSGTRDATLRVASTDSTNLTISITGTGLFEDTSGSDSVADTNSVVGSAASTTTAPTIPRFAVEMPAFAVVTSVSPPPYHRAHRFWRRAA